MCPLALFHAVIVVSVAASGESIKIILFSIYFSPFMLAYKAGNRVTAYHAYTAMLVLRYNYTLPKTYIHRKFWAGFCYV
jgi:hypothetical protein